MSDIIFNDASLYCTSVNTDVEAEKAFEDFIAEIAAAIDDGIVESVIRSQESLLDSEISLASGRKWPVYDWFDSPSIDPDARRLILTLDNKVPTESEYPLSAEDEESLMTYDYFIGGVMGVKCYAFGFALHTGSVVASIPTHNLWHNSQLQGYVCLNGNVVRKGIVPHLSKYDHCSDIRKILDEQLFESVNGRADFIAQKENIFKNLQFSPSVNEQALELTSRQIVTLLAKLRKMDRTAERWKTTNSSIPEYQFSWRGESSSTMNNPTLKKAREFQLPNGGIAVFENHLDFSSSHRIHFVEDTKNKSFIIGYVGAHLPTVLYPH